ncbi:unknown [Clostridium sp. CAG:1000]|jgi:hypothetical protein|nr:unknown [Clostridium sp. CAG:1000]
MTFKIIVSILIAIYYLIFIFNERKKDNDRETIKILSISLIIAYIIFLLLIWIVV